MKTITALALLATMLCAGSAAAEYVVLTGFGSDDPYHPAATRLARHHGTKHVLEFDPMMPEGIVPKLREIAPTHVAIVLRPEQIHVDSVRRILKASTSLDADPFVDFDYGYITGATPKDASKFVENMIRAAGKKLPLRLGRAAVWSGKRPCASMEGTYLTGGSSLPERSLVFTAPDGKKGRDQKFIDAHLRDLAGCGAIMMGGHGMPWEIGHGPRAEDVAKLRLFPSVVFNYACYTGTARRWPERVFERGTYHHKMNEVEAKRSFALAMLRTGAVGYVGYVNPRPAGPELSIDFHNVVCGMTLGEARREDHAKIVLGYLGFGEPGITVGDWPTGRRVPYKEVEPVRHMMLEGSTGGVLYGDPAYRPFPLTPNLDPVTKTVTRDGDALRIELSVRAREVYLWCADPFRQFDPKTRTMAMKLYARVELPKEFPEIGDVRVESSTWGGKPLDLLPVVWAEEVDRGKRYLHVKPGWKREMRGGPLALTLTAGRGERAVTPAAEATAEDWLQRAREAGEYVLKTRNSIKGENAYEGAAGVALFLFELHAATGEKRWLAPAQELLGRALFIEDAPGLYTGVAGVGHVCLEAWRLTGEKTYLDRAVECAERIGPPKGVDVIYGASGTGIFLLELHAATKSPRWLEEADGLGRYLADLAVRGKDGIHWPVAPNSPAVYYGFSHGAAGVGYFLMELHRAKGTKEYRALAEGAARFVAAHALDDGKGGWEWPKRHPKGEQDARVQWCHGSPGTGLFFLAMKQAYGEGAHANAFERCLANDRHKGRTARASGCFCHGVCGNAELFLEAYRATGDRTHLETALRFAADLVGPEGTRTSFTVGERRIPYGPAYMTGIAGIGRFFLRLADPEGTAPAFMVRR